MFPRERGRLAGFDSEPFGALTVWARERARACMRSSFMDFGAEGLARTLDALGGAILGGEETLVADVEPE